jgi:hypothetical protein
MKQEHFFHSKNRALKVCIRSFEGHKQTGEKYCQFVDGLYRPLKAKDPSNELGIDERTALQGQPSYGVLFFDSRGWLDRTTQDLDQASQDLVSDLQDQVEMLTRKQAATEAAYAAVGGINEVDLGEPSPVTVPQESPKPKSGTKKKAGRPKRKK